MGRRWIYTFEVGSNSSWIKRYDRSRVSELVVTSSVIELRDVLVEDALWRFLLLQIIDCLPDLFHCRVLDSRRDVRDNGMLRLH